MLEIRKIYENEIIAAEKIENENLETPWNVDRISSHIKNENNIYLAAFSNNEIVGIISASFGGGECSVYNLAVDKNHRRNGIAYKIMSEIIEIAKTKSCEEIFLEVGENNKAAISLYEKIGFLRIGKRKSFYGNESAYNMKLSLFQR